MIRRRVRRKTRRVKRQTGGAHTVDIVIARYKEDLEWLSNYKDMPFRRIFIYNKGPAMAPIPRCKIVPLPNVGFCDQTYLYHIIHEYGNLADITIFLPGSADLPNKALRTHEIINRAFKNEPMIYGRKVNGLYESMTDFAIDSSTLSDQDNQDVGKWYTLHPANYRPYGQWLNHYLPSQLACPYVSYKGMFSFSKDMIKKHTSDFYKPFLNQVSHHRFPEAAHYMERTWAALVYPFSESYFHRIPEKEISGF